MDDPTPLYGKLNPPKDLTPLRAINSFAIDCFFFPYPKEKFYFIDKYYLMSVCKEMIKI
jgi:hypothetical protein